MKKRLVFCENKTREIMTTVDTSRKIERMVEASASIILLASVKRDTDFPCPACRKKGHRQVKNMLDIGQNHINRQALPQNK